MEKRGVVGALGDILGRMFSLVCNCCGGVIAFTIVQDVGAIKVMDVEFFGNVIDDAVHVALDVGRNGRQEGRRGGAVKECLTEHGRVEG